MTREEAIKKLNALAWVQGGPDREEMIEAVSMAIESLSAEAKEEDLAKDIARRMATIIENEQDMRVILKNASAEPTCKKCTDLISRQAAIERFCELGTSLERQGKTMITMVDAKYAFIETLESLPSADRPNIAYICDGTACDGECDECHHTTDIEHAKNFKRIGIKYMEKMEATNETARK